MNEAELPSQKFDGRALPGIHRKPIPVDRLGDFGTYTALAVLVNAMIDQLNIDRPVLAANFRDELERLNIDPDGAGIEAVMALVEQRL